MNGTGAFIPFGLGLLVGAAASYSLLAHEPAVALSESKSQSDPPPFAISNPSEVFRLRSECEALAEKIVATSLTGDSGVQQQQESHYEFDGRHNHRTSSLTLILHLSRNCSSCRAQLQSPTAPKVQLRSTAMY